MPSASIIRRLFLQGISALILWFGLDHALSRSFGEESKKGSPAFERFRWSFFEDKDSARNGLDIPALWQLEGEERRRAEEMLLRYLPDSRAIIGLGELRSRRAAPELRRLFNVEREAQQEARRAIARGADTGWLPYDLLWLAKALQQIRPDPSLLLPVTEVLASAELDLQRQDAAQALSVFRDPGAVRALVAALDDPAALVRHHAARALLTLHGLPDEADVTKHGPEHMMFRVMSSDAARREGGKRDILTTIATRPIAAP
jgi:HEAT repeat protein